MLRARKREFRRREILKCHEKVKQVKSRQRFEGNVTRVSLFCYHLLSSVLGKAG